MVRRRVLQRLVAAVLIGASAISLAGCESSYATPGRGADMAALAVAEGHAEVPVGERTDSGIQDQLDKKPLAHFPASIAIARVESVGYRSYTNNGWGAGRYSVVTTRDIEDPNTIAELEKLPQIRGIAPIGRMLLPANLQSNYELRSAAAALRADMVLIYTIDTTFNTTDLAGPLTVVTLGLAPDQKISVTSTASAVLIDTRNGYVYGVCEATDQSDGLTIGWQTDQAVDLTRRGTESRAFRKMVGQLKDTWTKVLKETSIADVRPVG